MSWVELDADEIDWFKLDRFFHIWVEQTFTGKFFLMGDITDSGQDIVLSRNFDTLQECQDYARAILGVKQ